VVFSAPVAESGYVLDWSASGGELIDVGTDTLALGYADFRDAVARFLGYDPNALTDAQLSEVDSAVQAGVRQFYWPPAFEGYDPSVEWSFLKVEGSLEVEPGVAEYVLPDGFWRIRGQIKWPAELHRPSIPLVPWGDLRRDPSGTYPRFAAVTSRNALGPSGQLRKLRFSSLPDVRAVLTFLCDADSGPISATRPHPLGGAAYSECVMESCLAIAEQRSNDETGQHSQNFMRLLAASAARDRKSGAQVYGPMACPADYLMGY
jgi:hypothetical protein